MLRNSATEDAPTRTSESVAPTVEKIRQRVYEIFLARGGMHGNELEDWARAELELKQRDAATWASFARFKE
ncbi:MAG: DUF2934 domain-containing protein [Limisphaerales bacterium]